MRKYAIEDPFGSPRAHLHTRQNYRQFRHYWNRTLPCMVGDNIAVRALVIAGDAVWTIYDCARSTTLQWIQLAHATNAV